MKRNFSYLLLIVCISYTCPLLADEDCDLALLEAKTAFDVGEYEKAKRLYDYVVAICGAEYSNASIWSQKCQIKMQYNAELKRDGEDLILSVNGVSYRFVFVQGGSFLMGDNNIKKNVQDFYIGQTEVTQGFWKVVTNSYSKVVKGKNSATATSMPYAGYSVSDDGANYPASNRHFWEIEKFIIELNEIFKDALDGKKISLTTEAQWEYAANGGIYTHHYIYSGSNNLDEIAWHVGNCKEKHPVAQKKPNELGIYDMTGNVEEWCLDAFTINGSSLRYHPRKGGCYWPFNTGYRNKYGGHDSYFNTTDMTGFRLVINIH